MNKTEILQAIRSRIYGALKLLRGDRETEHAKGGFVITPPSPETEIDYSESSREWTEGLEIVLGNRSLTRIERDDRG